MKHISQVQTITHTGLTLKLRLNAPSHRNFINGTPLPGQHQLPRTRIPTMAGRVQATLASKDPSISPDPNPATMVQPQPTTDTKEIFHYKGATSSMPTHKNLNQLGQTLIRGRTTFTAASRTPSKNPLNWTNDYFQAANKLFLQASASTINSKTKGVT